MRCGILSCVSESNGDSLTVVLTFDDCNEEDFTIGKQVLGEYNALATFGIVTNWVGGSYNISGESGRRMTWRQIEQLHEAGHEIASHSENHMNLEDQSNLTLIRELNYSAHRIEERIARPRSLMYPYNIYDENTVYYAKECGYLYARTGWWRCSWTDKPYFNR
ncbi:unnamed protein product, partial [marine sediment metagenome]